MSLTRKGLMIMLGIVVMLIIIVAASMLWVLQSSLNTENKPQQTQSQSLADSLPRSDEPPLSLHRAFSVVAATNPTTYEPWGIAFDYTHGFAWLAEPGCEPTPKCAAPAQGAISQYALSDGSFIQDFVVPAGYSSPLFVAVDANGNVWFTQPNSDAIGEFVPQSESWHQWPVKKGSAPYDLTVDTHGNIWFTEFVGNNIGFFDPQTHTLVENPIPIQDSQPYGITLDPHGNIWFAENRDGLGQIGSFTPTSSGTVKITEHAVKGIRPHLIVADKAGNIWYSDGFSGHIGEFDPGNGSNNIFNVYFGTCTPASCTGTHISGIAADSQGHIWFTDSLSQRIGYLIPSSGQVVARTLKYANAHPNDGLAIDRDDRVWFSEQFAHTLTMWPVSAV
jgi:virginiamycin B lyase